MITICRITDHLTLVASFISRQPVAPLIVRCRSHLSAPPGIIVDVEHRVKAAGALALEVVLENAKQGEGLLVDEVIVRRS